VNPASQAVRFAVWLMPDETCEPPLRALIDGFSRRFGTPPFDPHLTLFSGQCRDLAVLSGGLAHLAGMDAPIALAVKGLRHSRQFFKTLFAALAAPASLTTSARSARDLLDPSSDYRLRPHVSLLYREMPAAERRALIAETAFPHAALRFDALALVSPGVDWRDLHAWRVLTRQSMAVSHT